MCVCFHNWVMRAGWSAKLKLRKSVPPRMTLPQSTDLEQDLFESEGRRWA